MNSLQPLLLAPVQVQDVETLWALCLEVVRRRRRGTVSSISAAVQLLDWCDSGGFSLTGDWDAAGRELFALLKPVIDASQQDAPWVIGQLGQSLDGCIATRGGDSHFVNGSGVLTHLHRLRALCDAVIIGAGTAAMDNPQLTTRLVAGDHPVRVVLDMGLRLAPDLKVFSDGQAPSLLVCDRRRLREATDRFGAAQVLGVPGLMSEDGSPCLPALIAALHERGLRMLFVEGGGVTVSRFIAQGCLDRLHLSIAPVLIGEGRRGLQVPQPDAMRDCLRLPSRIFHLAPDVLWDLDLRSQAVVS